MSVKNISPELSTFSILFATFSLWRHNERTPINGAVGPLKDFLVPKIKKLVIIDQLHPGSDEVMPKIEVYVHNNLKFVSHTSSWYLYILKPFLTICNTNGTQIFFKIRDFFSVIDWSFRDNTTFDYFIGLESINTLAGIMLRKLGRVRTVVYYVFDYSPNRFSNRLFNNIYIALDRFCAIHADYIWDVSKAMQPARVSVGLNPIKSAPVIHVPIGLEPDQIIDSRVLKKKKHSLVYMGTLGHENGPDIAIRALALVRKNFPDAILHIVGGSSKDVSELREFALKEEVMEGVIFYGTVPSNVEMSKIISSCEIGLAPYRYIAGSPRLYADSSKIRAYCASGIPTISSPVPPLGREIAQKGAALIAEDDPKSFAKAICALFQDSVFYNKLRVNAVHIGKNSTWENSFLDAFKEMEVHYDK